MRPLSYQDISATQHFSGHQHSCGESFLLLKPCSNFLISYSLISCFRSNLHFKLRGCGLAFPTPTQIQRIPSEVREWCAKNLCFCTAWGGDCKSVYFQSSDTVFRAPLVQGALPGCFQLFAAPLKVGCFWLNLLDTVTFLLYVMCLSCKWYWTHSSVQ